MNYQLKISTIPSILDNLTLKQSVNEKLLEKLITSSLLKKVFNNASSAIFYENEKQQLIALQKSIKHGVSDVKYKKPTGIKFGRVIPGKCLGLVSIRRQIRHTIARDYYIDIDIVNAHPVILHQICIHNSIECTNLGQYVKNRGSYLNEVMVEYNVSRDKAKTLFIRLLYFGSITEWMKNENITDAKPLDFLTNFKNELNNIGNIIVASYSALKK